MLCHTMVNDNVVASTVCTDTLSQEKKICIPNDHKLKRGTKALTCIDWYINFSWSDKAKSVCKENSEC